MQMTANWQLKQKINPMIWSKCTRKDPEFRAIGALKGDGVFESGILVMDWSWDVGRNTLKLPLEECTSRISKDYEGSLGEDKERSEVSYLQKYEELDPKKYDLKQTELGLKKRIRKVQRLINSLGWIRTRDRIGMKWSLGNISWLALYTH